MGEPKRIPTALTQVLVAVSIAILVGSTSPWWWKELRGLFHQQGTHADTSDPSGEDGCIQLLFQGSGVVASVVLEAGAEKQPIAPPSSQTAPLLGLEFTEQGLPLGGATIRYIPANQIFKVVAVVDSACEPVTEYSNSLRPGEKDTLQNWDVLRIRLGDRSFLLRLGSDGGPIEATFEQVP